MKVQGKDVLWPRGLKSRQATVDDFDRNMDTVWFEQMIRERTDRYAENYIEKYGWDEACSYGAVDVVQLSEEAGYWPCILDENEVMYLSDWATALQLSDEFVILVKLVDA